MVDNGQLVFVQDVDGTFANNISGSGSVEKTGAGMLTLSGTNSFSGGLLISRGVVIGSSQSIPGAVNLAAQADDGMGGMIPSGAQVIFDQSTDGTNSGGITGGGGLPAGTPTLIKRGSGLLILGGTNTYTGGTRLEAGGLQGTTSSLQGDIVDLAGTTLTFSQNSTGTYTGVIDGPGALVKQGSGTVSFTRTQSLDPGATTTIQGGRFAIGVSGQGDGAGTTLQEGVTVQAPGTLSGIGSVAGAVTNSGTIAPGGATASDAVGTLTVGSATFNAGSVLRVDAGNTGTDLLKATGAAALGTSAILHVDLGNLSRSAPFSQPVLEAGSITGSIFTLDPSETFAFFDAAVVQSSATTISLELTPNGKLLPDFATTHNEQAVGQALEDAFAAAPPGSDIVTVFDELGKLSTAAIPKALNDMAGEQLTEFATARLAIANRFQSSLMQRVRGVAWGDGEALISQQGGAGAPPVLAANPLLEHGLPGIGQGFALAGAALPVMGAQTLSMQGGVPSFGPGPGELGLGGWVDGYGLFGKLSGSSDTADLDYTIGGVSLGIDYRLAPHWLLGIAGGYAYTSLDFQGLSGSQTANTGQGALYGGYVTPWLQIGASGRFGYSAMSTSREIDFNDRNADGDFNGWDAGARVDAALDVYRLGPVEFQPIASFSYTHVQQDSFDESGANSLNLAVDSQTIDSLVSGAGGRIHGVVRIDEHLWFHPELRAAWLHEFGDRDRELTARIGGIPGGGFDVRGAQPSADTGVFGIAWTVVVDGRLHAFLGYDVSVSSALIEHSATLGFKAVW
jgi:autotransporter-associated beta strand protein